MLSPDTLDQTNLDLCFALSSRICHDLISPVGAIGNGLELIEAIGGPASPELDLIRDSAARAENLLRFTRIAFGAARSDAFVPMDEIIRATTLGLARTRLEVTVDSGGQSGIPRPAARAAMLTALCLSTALPFGGALDVSFADAAGPVITARDDRLKVSPDLSAALTGRVQDEISTSSAPFMLLALLLQVSPARAVSQEPAQIRVLLKG